MSNPNLFRRIYDAQQRIAYLKVPYVALFAGCVFCCYTGTDAGTGLCNNLPHWAIIFNTALFSFVASCEYHHLQALAPIILSVVYKIHLIMAYN